MAIKIGDEEVILDEKILEVNHDTINEFLSKYAAWYRYYQNKHNDATLITRSYTDQLNALIQGKFRYFKEAGATDKLAEASAKSDEEVLALQKKVRQAEYVKDELWGFLKSMDYAHDNAKELCWNLRKEMSAISGSRVYNKIDEMYGVN